MDVRFNVVEPPRPIPIMDKLYGRKVIRRAVDEGIVAMYPYREIMDEKEFATQKIIKSYTKLTIVMDWSGSMRMMPSQVAKIMEVLPQVCFAYYSGGILKNEQGGAYLEDRGVPINGGTLAVLCDKGTAVDIEATPIATWRAGGGNAVDRQALAWLAHRPGVHIWISDGGVTDSKGNSDSATRTCFDAVVTGNLSRRAHYSPGEAHGGWSKK